MRLVGIHRRHFDDTIGTIDTIRVIHCLSVYHRHLTRVHAMRRTDAWTAL